MSGQRPTLRDVAQHAGVSMGTASNAFNRPALVAEDTRARVLDAAEALGFAGPDPAARRLRTGTTGAVGLVFTDALSFAFGDAAATAFLRGVAEGLEDDGTSLLIVPTSPDREGAARLVREAAVDAFIVYSTAADDPRLEAALARGVPAVVVDQPTGVDAPFVGIDDRAAARAAARHLRDLGHEQVAVLSFAGVLHEPDRATTEPVKDVTVNRLDGYRDVFPGAERVRCKPNDPEVGRAATRELLRRDDPPTALLAMSDALAAGALLAAQDLGKAVPEDLSVVGFDDSPVAALTTPPLTTVAQPLAGKGRAAVRSLRDGGRTLLPAELVLRGTTGPPGG